MTDFSPSFMQRLTFFVLAKEIVDFVTGKSVNFDVLFHPEQYSLTLPVEKIIADSKVSREGIEAYKKRILNKENIGPITVLKHPDRAVYVVLDGHHRFYACSELGKQDIICAIAGDSSRVLFYLTLRGSFQPNPLITCAIRNPLFTFKQNLKHCLINIENSE
jgi:hypothetical protein